MRGGDSHFSFPAHHKGRPKGGRLSLKYQERDSILIWRSFGSLKEGKRGDRQIERFEILDEGQGTTREGREELELEKGREGLHSV